MNTIRPKTGTPHGTESSHDETDTDEASESRQRLRSALLGLKGGAFATFVMTVFRTPISKSLPPTAEFWAKFVAGGDPEDHPLPAFILHFVYGVSGGVLYGILFERPDERTRAGIELHDLARALVFSLGLSLFGSRVILSRLLGMDLERDESLMFHVGHVIYGLALGAWVGSKR